MEDLVLLLLLIFLGLILGIVGLMSFKKYSAEQAVRVLKGFVKSVLREMFGLNKFKQHFPLLLGYDETGRADYSKIDVEFSEIAKHFKICFLEKTQIIEEKGMVRYQYRFISKPDGPIQSDLQKIIQLEVEKIVQNSLNYQEIQNLSASSVVHVEIDGCILMIALALNSVGIVELERRKRYLMVIQIKQSVENKQDGFAENWSEKNGN